MTLFYLLIVLTALASVNLMLGFTSLGSKQPRRIATQRRRALITPEQARIQAFLQQGLGDQRRVLPTMPLNCLISPTQRTARSNARRWLTETSELSADLAVLSGDGTQALCALLLTAAGKQTRRRRREQQRIATLCKQAGLPVATVSAAEQNDLDALHARLEELIWPLEESLQSAQAVTSEDEDALLAGLAAAARDRGTIKR